ncbi:MAG TPA: rRNA maturation RNase YbeY [bacterium]|jgi:probable rRNA maturation factor|nr:rRNA maturation RNase YbeY [bacterium]
MRVLVHSRVRRPGIAARALRRIALAALRAERMPAQTEVSIILVGDASIRRLNRRFLGKDRPTDVLAFPLLPGGPPTRERARPASNHRHRLLGEIVISINRARQQAKAAGHAVRTEVALLAVHGVLHLAGFDDRSSAGARRMHGREREILRVLGEDVRG